MPSLHLNIEVRQWSPIWLPRWSMTMKILVKDRDHFTIYMIKVGEN